MLPGRFNRLSHHVYKEHAVELLKLNVMYGANGAGKSNLIRSLNILKIFLTTGEMPVELITETFKFDKESSAKDIYLGIEFTKEKLAYYYGLTINRGIVVEEELHLSGLGKTEDIILFRRTDKITHTYIAAEKSMELVFSEEVMKDKEASIFPSFLKNEMLERNKPVLFYMKNRQNDVFEPFKKALEWFEKDLEVVLPQSRAQSLVLHLEGDTSFREFATNTIQSFDTGISNIYIETTSLEDSFTENDKEAIESIGAQLRVNPEKMHMLNNSSNYTAVVLEGNKPVIKKVFYSHGKNDNEIKFQSSELSDGTRRLLDYLPTLFAVINTSKTYLIDEIERSIHPLLIKELIKKFSHDPATKGQLIFSTHESNLLDQDIFRPDEIWFAEKNKQGATELYALSEFKEHHTIDIRKGYLNGRYGGIPFLGNLRDLNWEEYAQAK